MGMARPRTGTASKFAEQHAPSDPQHWLDRAAEARAMAEKIIDPNARQAMLDLAASYEVIAKRAAHRRQQADK